jgi:hypothetical protein
MMLKDQQGRTVLIKGGYHDRRYQMEFFARDGLTLIPVEEAIISKGDDITPTTEQIKQWISDAGFPNLHFSYDCVNKPNRQSWLQVNYESSYERVGGMFSSGPSVRVCKIAGHKVPEETFERLSKVLSALKSSSLVSSVYFACRMGSFFLASGCWS